LLLGAGLVSIPLLLVFVFCKYMYGFGLSYWTMPGLAEVVEGQTYDQVVDILGQEDGVLRAHELVSYHMNRFRAAPGDMPDFEGIEDRGGQHLFWLSKSGRLLIVNVVSFDQGMKVVGTYSGYDTYLGLNEKDP
jgi:hypothetical protein